MMAGSAFTFPLIVRNVPDITPAIFPYLALSNQYAPSVGILRPGTIENALPPPREPEPILFSEEFLLPPPREPEPIVSSGYNYPPPAEPFPILSSEYLPSPPREAEPILSSEYLPPPPAVSGY